MREASWDWYRLDPQDLQDVGDLLPIGSQERWLWLSEATTRGKQWSRASLCAAITSLFTAVFAILWHGKSTPEGTPILLSCFTQAGAGFDQTVCSVALLDEWSATHVSSGFLYYWLARCVLSDRLSVLATVLMTASVFEYVENHPSTFVNHGEGQGYRVQFRPILSLIVRPCERFQYVSCLEHSMCIVTIRVTD